jgi:hypothetical protein
MSGVANASTGGQLAIAAASVTQEAGLLLQRLAYQGGNVTLRAPDLPRIDVVSAAALWAMAVGTVVVGALWSAAELRQHMAAAARPVGQVRHDGGAECFASCFLCWQRGRKSCARGAAREMKIRSSAPTSTIS